MKKRFSIFRITSLIYIREFISKINISLLTLFCIYSVLLYNCDDRKSPNVNSEKKIEYKSNIVHRDSISKTNIVKEERVPLSVFFQDSHSIDSSFKAMKNMRLMSFNLSNENPDSLGLIFNPNAVSIEAIKIVDSYAYLSDPVHSNIKKICLKSGAIFASKPLENERFESYLEEIAYFNGLLYVLSHRNKIFRLTLDLDYLDDFSMPEGHFNNNYLFSDRGEKLVVFSDGINDFIVDEKTRPSENVIDEKTKIFQRRLHIDDQLSFSYDTLGFKNHSEYREWITSLKGHKIEFDGKPFYFCNGLKYEVPLDFPEGEFFRGVFGRNIDCSEQYLTFFKISLEEKKLYLHVYEY